MPLEEMLSRQERVLEEVRRSNLEKENAQRNTIEYIEGLVRNLTVGGQGGWG